MWFDLVQMLKCKWILLNELFITLKYQQRIMKVIIISYEKVLDIKKKNPFEEMIDIHLQKQTNKNHNKVQINNKQTNTPIPQQTNQNLHLNLTWVDHSVFNTVIHYDTQASCRVYKRTTDKLLKTSFWVKQ